MNRLFTLSLLFFVVFAAASAQTNVVVSFDHKIGANPLVLNETVFPIWNNKKVKITRAQFYISEVEIQNIEGATVPLTNQFLLVNANAPTAEFALGSWPVQTSSSSVTLHLGVPEAINHLDPVYYPAGHPLALQNPTMHWGWTSGYRFMAIEGLVDNNGDGVPETIFEYHNLGDALYKTVTFTGTNTVENGVLHLHFILDYVQLFKNLAINVNLIQHGSSIMNATMMTNAATEHFITLQSVSATQDPIVNSLQVKASPNPANTETNLTYTLPATGAIDLVLTNTLGQTVRTVTGLTATGSTLLETAALPEGIYQYAFYENGTLLARKQLVVKH